MDPNIMENVAQQLKNNPELARMIMEEKQKMEHQVEFKVLVTKITGDCWDKCVTKVGDSLGRQETCLTNCAERYLDTDHFIRKRMSSSPQQH